MAGRRRESPGAVLFSLGMARDYKSDLTYRTWTGQEESITRIYVVERDPEINPQGVGEMDG